MGLATCMGEGDLETCKKSVGTDSEKHLCAMRTFVCDKVCRLVTILPQRPLGQETKFPFMALRVLRGWDKIMGRCMGFILSVLEACNNVRALQPNFSYLLH